MNVDPIPGWRRGVAGAALAIALTAAIGLHDRFAFADSSARATSLPAYATLDEWIRREAIPFSPDSAASLNATVDKVVGSLDQTVELLGFGEAMHGAEDILTLRNLFFERLAQAHGYSAIAIESGFPEGHAIDAYAAGGPGSYESAARDGWPLAANRELIEWMRHYNADPTHRVKLRFYGFDISGAGTARILGPDRVLHLALDYLASIEPTASQERRQRIDSLLARLSGWENPDVWIDKAKAPGLTPAATSLRIATEDLVTEFRTRRPELVAKSDEDRYLEALQYALIARQTLDFHAAIARESGEPLAGPRGIRDALMADNLSYIAGRERGRGKVFVFAHSLHLQRGVSVWPCCGQKYRGTDVYQWWPAGAQLNAMFGNRYAVIGTAVAVSQDNGIAAPEPGTLEARLTAVPGPAMLIPTHAGQVLSNTDLAALKPRSGSQKNSSYAVLEAHSLTDFDWLAVLDSTTMARGWPP